MKNFFSLKNRAALGRFFRFGCAGLGLALGALGVAQAQAPVWDMAAGSSQVPNEYGVATCHATAVDASGNVFVTGQFDGSVRFGSTSLTSAGNYDMFVAKWDAVAQAYTWATSSGGATGSCGWGIAVNGTGVYVTGSFYSVAGARMAGQALAGAGGQDAFVAKYVDTSTGHTPATSSFANAWATSAGGAGSDAGNAIAVRGTGVYVTGFFDSGMGVRIAGQALAGAGGLDVFVAKYVDTGTSSTPATSSFANAWATSGGGVYVDVGNAIAVHGTGVYVTGFFGDAFNGSGSGGSARMAGQALASAGGPDIFVAKYVDTGTGNTPATSSFANAWATSAGGTGGDGGRGIAVSGAGVFVTGSFDSNANARIAGQALAGAGSRDVFVAKYVDVSTGHTPATSGFANAWATSGGGTGYDFGWGIAVRGTGVYVAGYFISNANARMAGQALAGAGNEDVFVAKYVDTSTGSTPATSSFANAWATSAGGTGGDYGLGLAVSGTGVYVAGQAGPRVAFGPLALGPGAGSNSYGDFLARLPTTVVSSTRPASSLSALTLSPNPARAALAVAGAPAGAAVAVFDALGRPVATAPADAAGTARLRLPAGLAAGVYVVRAGGQSARLAVE